jgi:hypothetical protein
MPDLIDAHQSEGVEEDADAVSGRDPDRGMGRSCDQEGDECARAVCGPGLAFDAFYAGV